MYYRVCVSNSGDSSLTKIVWVFLVWFRPAADGTLSNILFKQAIKTALLNPSSVMIPASSLK